MIHITTSSNSSMSAGTGTSIPTTVYSASSTTITIATSMTRSPALSSPATSASSSRSSSRSPSPARSGSEVMPASYVNSRGKGYYVYGFYHGHDAHDAPSDSQVVIVKEEKRARERRRDQASGNVRGYAGYRI